VRFRRAFLLSFTFKQDKMKHSVVLKSLLLIIAIGILQSCSNTNQRHIGEWKGIDNKVNQPVSLVLDKSNHAVFVEGNQVLGGKDFVINGVKAECKYEIDYSKSPIWLDLLIYEQGKTEAKTRIKGIVQFITDNKMQYRFNISGDRFEKFDPEDQQYTMVLEKVNN
jgi:hypothetical protein